MAELGTTNLADFRRQLLAMDEATTIAQIVMHHGQLHALNYLLKHGVTEANVHAMIASIEELQGIVEQVAASRGIYLPVQHL